MKSIKSMFISRLRSFRYAFNGLGDLLRKEPNARIHLFAVLAAIVMGIITKITLVEWIIVTVVAGMVFISEIINTAVERLADLIDQSKNEKIRAIKNYSAAAVLVSAIIALIAGLLIFIPGLVDLIR